jgi:adenylate cyclase
MSDVFISYARSTQPQAERIEDALRALGYSVWRDDQLPAHRAYAEVLDERLKAAKAVVVLWSAEAVKSEWVQSEADRARNDRKLVQLKLDATTLPMPFDRIQCANLAGWKGDLDAPGWKKVLASIEELTGEAGAAHQPAAAPAHPVPSKPSIAVLPFLNMSDDRQQEFLADGMTEDIITGLSCDARLFVIARNSTFSYKGKSPNIRDVGRELSVRYVLEGSVRRMGEALRVTAQLIEASSGAHVWAEKRDCPLSDIFRTQDEITEGITAALTAHLTHSRSPAAERSRPENLDAWELYVQALGRFATGLEPQVYREAEALLREAVKKDPNYADAWGLLGDLLSQRFQFAPADYDPSKDLDEARTYIERAEALAPDSPAVAYHRGVFLLMSIGGNAALASMRRAVDRNPNDTLYRLGLAMALHYAAQPAAAIEELERAVRLSPRDALANVFFAIIASCKFALEDYVEAEKWSRRAIAEARRNFMGWHTLALALAAQDKVEAARDALREAARLSPNLSRASVMNPPVGILRDFGAIVALQNKYLTIAWPPELD